MSENLLDKHFKEKLGNYASRVPEGMWERIAEETKRKPKVIWLNPKFILFLSLFALSVLIGSFLLVNQDKKSAIALNNQENKNYLPSNNYTSSNSSQNEIANNKNEVNDKEIVSSGETFNQNNKGVDNKYYDDEQKVANQNTASSNQHNSKITIAKKSNYQKNTQEKIVSKQKEFADIVISKEKYTDNYDDVIQKNKINSTVNNTNVDLVNSLFAKGNLVYTDFLKSNIIIEKKLLKTNYKPVDCPDFGSKERKTIYLEAYAAPEFTLRKLTAFDSSGLGYAYKKMKDSAEKMSGGFTVGVRLGKSFLHDKLIVKAGLQYSQLNERLNILRESDRKTITVITIKTITDALGNSVTVSDTSTLVQIGYSSIKSNNFYRNIEVPVSASYQIVNGKWKVYLNAGAIVNISSSFQGKVIAPSYQLINVSPKENSEVYQQKTTLSLIGGFTLIKPVSERLDLFFEPYYRVNLSNSNSSIYGLNQKFSAYGLSVGVRFRLNNLGQRY